MTLPVGEKVGDFEVQYTSRTQDAKRLAQHFFRVFDVFEHIR